MIEDLILKTIDEKKQDFIQFLKDLIQIDSFNPPGNEKNVAVKIKSFLEELNIKCEIYPFENNRANLVAYLNDNFESKNLLYNAHMDVVPPGTESEWKKILTPEQFHVMRKAGTEKPFSGKYNDHYIEGIYHCVGCGTPLFSSATKNDLRRGKGHHRKHAPDEIRTWRIGPQSAS